MAPLRPRRISSNFKSKGFAIQCLRIFWVVLVLWFDFAVYYLSVARCRWPDKALRVAGAPSPKHVLLVADAQVLDPQPSSFVDGIAAWLYELNLRKSWSVTMRFKPDMIVFLGDMLEDGRYVRDNEQFRHYAEHFKKRFRPNAGVPVHYVVGNRDVGLGDSASFSQRTRKRYVEHFGPVQQVIEVANHTLVFLDAPGLVEEDYRRFAAGANFEDWSGTKGGSIEFVKSFATHPPNDPVILLSHIPLARPESASCGPLREKGSIRRGVGPGYQNMIGKQTTGFILESVRPTLIFSADDHDYCDYTHVAPRSSAGRRGPARVREVTVKAFSLATGIRRPGFQLLSLAETGSADAMCLLPSARGIVGGVYTPLAILTALALLYTALLPQRGARPAPLWDAPLSHGQALGSAGLSTSSPPHTPLALVRNGLRSASLQPPTARISRPSTPVPMPPPLQPVLATGLADEDNEQLPTARALYPGPPKISFNNGDVPPTPSELEFGGAEHDASYFLPAPGTRKVSASASPRRRGVFEMYAIRVLAPLRAILAAPSSSSPRTGVIRTFLRDLVLTMWPAVVIWAFMAWWMPRT